MGNFTQNNINFTVNEYTPTKLTNRASTATYDALLAGRGKEIINAIEIDWNGAELDKDRRIETTSELLNLINDMLKNFKTNEGNILQLAVYEPDQNDENTGTLVL